MVKREFKKKKKTMIKLSENLHIDTRSLRVYMIEIVIIIVLIVILLERKEKNNPRWTVVYARCYYYCPPPSPTTTMADRGVVNRIGTLACSRGERIPGGIR